MINCKDCKYNEGVSPKDRFYYCNYLEVSLDSDAENYITCADAEEKIKEYRPTKNMIFSWVLPEDTREIKLESGEYGLSMNLPYFAPKLSEIQVYLNIPNKG